MINHTNKLNSQIIKLNFKAIKLSPKYAIKLNFKAIKLLFFYLFIFSFLDFRLLIFPIQQLNKINSNKLNYKLN